MSQKGEIATTITVFTVMLMTLGLVIGSLVTFERTTLTTEAQSSASVAPNSGNPDVEIAFSPITRRSGTSQKQITVSLCFKDHVRIPSSGNFAIQAALKRKTGDDIALGSSVQERILSNRELYKCTGGKRDYKVFMYSSLNDLKEKPNREDITGIVFNIVTSGNFDPKPQLLLGTLSDISVVFGLEPPTSGPTPVFEPKACPQLANHAPAGVIQNALANPSNISGWSELEKPNEPESDTNKRKTLLTLQDIDLRYDTIVNPLIFTATCPEPSEPGKLTVNVTFQNTSFTGAFDGFAYNTQTCDLDEAAYTGTYKGESKDCGTGVNKKVTHTMKKPATQPFTETLTDTFENIPGGKRIVQLPYGFWRNFDTPQARKDNSGVLITFNGTVCVGKIEKGSLPSCLLTVNNDTTLNISISLPDTAKKTLRLGYKDSPAGCTIVTDGSASLTRTGNPCSGFFNKSSGILRLDYVNNTDATKSSLWEIVRCHGDLASNRNTCTKNDFVTDTIDVKNFFSEASATDIPAGKIRTCRLKITDYPFSDETESKVKEVITCEIVPIPSPTTGTTPPASRDTYTATLSIYNSASVSIVKVFTKACANGENCVDDAIDTDIRSQTRGVVEFDLGNVTPNVRFFTLRVAVQLADQNDSQGFNQELNVSDPQNVYYDLKVTSDDVTGTAKTEFSASDISGNDCVNADDASKVINKLADISAPDKCAAEDINCDGVVNTLDLSVIISNLNKGQGCAFNN